MIFLLLFIFVTTVNCNLDRPEESPCEWEGMKGICVNMRRCPSIAYDRLHKNPPPICSFQGDTPVVCCLDCVILKSKYHYRLPYECKTKFTLYHKKTLVEDKKCYMYELGAASPVGGADALRGDFPHIALLGYGVNRDTAQWLCGGSLISARFILTAGHCGSHVQLGPVKYVALGMLKRSDLPSYWKHYDVKQFIPHPGYRSPNKYHDIALIETTTIVDFTEGVRPACLTYKLEFRGDDEAYTTGWGSLGPHRSNADVMQKVIVNKFTEKECSALYPPHRHLPSGYNHTTQMCYGSRDKAIDTCEGDSGGPLQKRDPDAKHCVYVIIGVTSYGKACGTPGLAGMYTRVQFYLPWIENIVWP